MSITPRKCKAAALATAPVAAALGAYGFLKGATTVSYTHLTLPTNREV